MGKYDDENTSPWPSSIFGYHEVTRTNNETGEKGIGGGSSMNEARERAGKALGEKSSSAWNDYKYESGGGESSGCFITSACVRSMGYGDDCHELKVLRDFRDGYVMKMSGGKEAIRKYYEIAPSIVEKIDSSKNREDIYREIYGSIKKAVQLVEGGRKEEAFTTYVDEVSRLRRELGV